jgi:hypothetical protein
MGAMAPASSTAETPAPPGHSVGYNLGVIALTVTMAGLALAYGVSIFARSAGAGPSAGAAVARTLLGKQLSIPAAWLDDPHGPTEGFASRVDLTLKLPLGIAGAIVPVGIMLVPLSQVQPSVAMLDGVYLHEFTQGELTGPPGLIGKPLSASEGYAGETVWYDPLSPNPFVAKCDTVIGVSGPAHCLRSVALKNGIAAVFSFDASVLGQWKAFDPALQGVLQQFGAL